jgi:hypothetical protein
MPLLIRNISQALLRRIQVSIGALSAVKRMCLPRDIRCRRKITTSTLPG